MSTSFLMLRAHPHRRRAVASVLLPVLLSVTLVASGRPAEAERPAQFGIGRRELTLVDSTRPTMADDSRGLVARPDRTVRAVVLYPTNGARDDAAPDDAAAGPFPTVMFSHGLGAHPATYAGFFAAFVRDGYVVVLPEFPLSSGRGASAADYVNQPADVSFVIDELTRLSNDADSWFAGRLDQGRIGAAGHSLGALNTLALALNQCCVDFRVAAAAALSGGERPFPGGTWDDRPATPLLLVHGVADEGVPVAASDAVFAAAAGPASYLRLAEADHTGLFFAEDGLLTLQALKAFFDAELRGERDDLGALAALVEASGRGEWRSRRGS